MKGFWKKLTIATAIAGVVYLGYKAYRVVKDIIKLSDTLPDYLKDLIDEKPKVDVNMKLNSLSIAIGLSADTFENINFDIEEQIRCYIADYYPALSKLKITVQQYMKANTDDFDPADESTDYETVEGDENGEYKKD